MVLLSVLLAIVAGVMLYFFDIVPVDQDPGEQTVVETTSLAKEYGPKVIPFLAIPVLITAAAWFATRWSGRRRRRVYVVAAVMMWLWIMLNFTLGLLYIVSAISLSVGAWQYVNALRGEAPGTGEVEGDDGDEDVEGDVDEDVDDEDVDQDVDQDVDDEDDDEDVDEDGDEDVDEDVDEDEGEFAEDDDLDENEDDDEEGPARPTVSSRLRRLFGR
jgi:hypothetical protein